ncbi:Zinc finger CCCH domain-containing protein 48 [Trypanosoma equiperdum]|uniref:C3H1-type domain-containing protein n=3 Tax=Trypanozoon TaxID=39700 RepID=Q38DY2_TRYB2|nr:zinc finger protein, predicted [Trypanosoma brucei gambiense DAL972]XP_827318.1 hypothetical protein, conserved [Trypanosoma brucei brucei TREU927]EAN76988.1 hypothetical protein, conserved [Trypanosoma brucei brucei TREU927]CBH14519.1 zinc finger protein, predicted [Trypanosoma brucei gambiense DAL972]SCU68624.1 Zinc finger CCCH domain-containing protein 48 [Trypanosoma equiperdum]|eukprot:XP_011776785.1 zinc finger protein, predicted [Trypanosoma brucei gambiense DAL972]
MIFPSAAEPQPTQPFFLAAPMMYNPLPPTPPQTSPVVPQCVYMWAAVPVPPVVRPLMMPNNNLSTTVLLLGTSGDGYTKEASVEPAAGNSKVSPSSLCRHHLRSRCNRRNCRFSHGEDPNEWVAK